MPKVKKAKGVYGMTPRRRQVLRYYLRGWSARRIAEKLGITKRTVECHIFQAKKLMGFSGSRRELYLEVHGEDEKCK